MIESFVSCDIYRVGRDHCDWLVEVVRVALPECFSVYSRLHPQDSLVSNDRTVCSLYLALLTQLNTPSSLVLVSEESTTKYLQDSPKMTWKWKRVRLRRFFESNKTNNMKLNMKNYLLLNQLQLIP